MDSATVGSSSGNGSGPEAVPPVPAPPPSVSGVAVGNMCWSSWSAGMIGMSGTIANSGVGSVE
eukprot:2506712-Prorocentrum_lima.AAC.1